jgi:molybdopterin biosynthesis enzyme
VPWVASTLTTATAPPLAADLLAACDLRTEEASQGGLLVPDGAPVTPAVIGLAAATGHDAMRVRPRPRAAVVVFGAELLSSARL